MLSGEGGEGSASAAAPRGEGCGASHPVPRRGGAAGLGGRPPASPHPGSVRRRCFFLLLRLRARGGEGGKRATSGRGLAGRCRPRSPRSARSDRPGNRGPIPASRGGDAPVGDPAWTGAQPLGAAGPPEAAAGAASVAGRGGARRPQARGRRKPPRPVPGACPPSRGLGSLPGGTTGRGVARLLGARPRQLCWERSVPLGDGLGRQLAVLLRLPWVGCEQRQGWASG